MPTPDQIAADPEWLPNRVDAKRRQVQFVRFPRAAIESRPFLANQTGEGEAWLSFDTVVAMRLASCTSRFIFHSGFCCSTLLLRALCGSGRALGLNEPKILNCLARETVPEQVTASILHLLFRPHREHEAVIVKPSNFPNQLIPALMHGERDARAIIITNGLEDYLRSVARKGLEGRQWGRQVTLTAAQYAGDIGRLHAQFVAFTDLQMAALGWLLMQNWFTRVQVPELAGRVAVLHSESLTADGRTALTGAAKHLQLELPPREIDAILTGPVFATDAKTGVDFATLRAHDAARSELPVIEEEIAEVADWIAQLAATSGLAVPVPQSLPSSQTVGA